MEPLQLRIPDVIPKGFLSLPRPLVWTGDKRRRRCDLVPPPSSEKRMEWAIALILTEAQIALPTLRIPIRGMDEFYIFVPSPDLLFTKSDGWNSESTLDLNQVFIIGRIPTNTPD